MAVLTMAGFGVVVAFCVLAAYGLTCCPPWRGPRNELAPVRRRVGMPYHDSAAEGGAFEKRASALPSRTRGEDIVVPLGERRLP